MADIIAIKEPVTEQKEDEQAANKMLEDTGHVTGIGGVFFRARGDQQVLNDWYEKNLGMKFDHGMAILNWSDEKDKEDGVTAWKTAPDTTEWFAPSKSEFMINYRVDNLDKIHERLKASNAEIIKGPETYDYGKFLSVLDPDGNRVELWEPPALGSRDKK